MSAMPKKIINTAKFANSGNVLVNGDTIAYTGKGAATLTGVTGIQAGGHAVNSLIIQSTNPSTWVEEKGTILLNYQGRMLVMNVLGREEIIYYSAISDLTNPAFFYDFDGNGSYSKVMPGKCTAGIIGGGGGYIFMEKGVHELLGFHPQSGALLTREISANEGAYNQNCAVDMDGQVSFMGRKRWMPISLTLDPTGKTAPFLGDSFDHNIRPWFESHDDNEDQDDAYLKWDSTQKICKAGAIVNGALQTYVYDKQNPGFLPRENRPVGTSFMLNGKSYFVDRDNGKCYEDDVGRTNDTVPIVHQFTTGQIEHDKGRTYMKGQYFSYEGWMTQGTLHYVRVYIGGSTTASLSHEFSWEDLIDITKGRAIGLRGIGLSTPGGSAGGKVTVYPFQNDIIIRGLNEDSFRVEWEVTGEGQFFQIFTWYLSAHPTRRQPRDKR